MRGRNLWLWGLLGTESSRESHWSIFSVRWQLRKLLCWLQIPSHIVFMLFKGHKSSIFSRPVMLSVNLFMTVSDFPFHKFSFTVHQFHTFSQIIFYCPILLSWLSWSVKFILYWKFESYYTWDFNEIIMFRKSFRDWFSMMTTFQLFKEE